MGALNSMSNDEAGSSLEKRSSCYNAGDFQKYFTENMTALGLPTPNSLFTSFAAALGNTRVILSAIAVGGAGATIGELALATTLAEGLTVVAGVTAAGYVGAVVGSLIVATQRSLSCGATIADAIFFIQEHALKFKTPKVFFANNPEILNPSMANRSNYAKRYTIK